MIILKELYRYQDLKFKDFEASLSPTLNKDYFIGVKAPILKSLAKEIKYDEKFLNDLPHSYFEEQQLHVYILNNIKDYDIAIKKVNEFLPYINNWATCDSLKINCFKKHKEELIKEIKKWLKSKEEYIVRYGINCLMTYYLDDDFKKDYLILVGNIKSEKYYINMMRAWYFQVALVKKYAETYKYLKDNKLDEWTLKKMISKCHDSYRIDNVKRKQIDKLI